jgi:hypothetical protein
MIEYQDDLLLLCASLLYAPLPSTSSGNNTTSLGLQIVPMLRFYWNSQCLPVRLYTTAQALQRIVFEGESSLLTHSDNESRCSRILQGFLQVTQQLLKHSDRSRNF